MQLRNAFLQLIPRSIRKCLTHEKLTQFGTKSAEKSLHRLLVPTPIPPPGGTLTNAKLAVASLFLLKGSNKKLSSAEDGIGMAEADPLNPPDIHL
jgi:hypothetical protein